MSDALVNGLAGAGGGLVAQLLTYPLQTLNTREQIERKLKKKVTADLGNPTHRTSILKKLTQNEFIKVVKQEGWIGLYRGLGPSLIGTVCSQGVYYYFYQLLKLEAEALARRRKRRGLGDGSMGMLGALVVAALAGCVNVLMTNPIWVIVTRMQTQAKAQVQAKLKPLLESNAEADPSTIANLQAEALSVSPQGAWATARELHEEAGILGFWKGVVPTLIMVCNPAIQFMLYETLVRWLTTKRARKKTSRQGLTALEVFAFASIGKLGATVVTYPLLVVKSRLQAKQSISGGDKNQEYTGTLDAFVKMVYQEGILGLYRGMSTKIVQSVIAAAILLMIKEELVKGIRTVASKNRKAILPMYSKSLSSED